MEGFTPGKDWYLISREDFPPEEHSTPNAQSLLIWLVGDYLSDSRADLSSFFFVFFVITKTNNGQFKKEEEDKEREKED